MTKTIIDNQDIQLFEIQRIEIKGKQVHFYKDIKSGNIYVDREEFSQAVFEKSFTDFITSGESDKFISKRKNKTSPLFGRLKDGALFPSIFIKNKINREPDIDEGMKYPLPEM